MVNSTFETLRMGRPAKVTKHSLDIALSRSLNVAQVARYLAVDRHTVYDAAERFGVDLSTAFERFSTQEQLSPAPATPEPSSQPIQSQPVVEQAPKPQIDLRRFRLAEYMGPYRGDVSSSAVSGLPSRYQKLRESSDLHSVW